MFCNVDSRALKYFLLLNISFANLSLITAAVLVDFDSSGPDILVTAAIPDVSEKCFHNASRIFWELIGDRTSGSLLRRGRAFGFNKAIDITGGFLGLIVAATVLYSTQ